MHKFQRLIGWRLLLVPLILLNLSAQDRIPPPQVQLPRDADKLIARAQAFWKYLVEDQKAKALEFVAEESRNLFLRGEALPLLGAQVIGLDLSANQDEAIVRTKVKGLLTAVGASAGWELSNRWIRKGNNWYVEIGNSKSGVSLLSAITASPETSGNSALDAELRVPEVFDIGTVIQGRPTTIKFPVEYSGKLSFIVESLPRTFIYTVSEPLSLTTHSFNFYVNPNSPHGEFTLPLKVSFYGEAVKVERNVTLKGKILVPLTFRQVPDALLKPGETLRVFVRNNTSQPVGIRYISSELEGEVLQKPDVLQPGEEAEILYKPLTRMSPERLDLTLTEPVFDIPGFSFTFRKTP